MIQPINVCQGVKFLRINEHTREKTLIPKDEQVRGSSSRLYSFFKAFTNSVENAINNRLAVVVEQAVEKKLAEVLEVATVK